MENQFYKVEMSDKHKLEFYVCDTNEVSPYRKIKDLGIVIYKVDVQIDGSLDANGLDSLIKYLSECRDYINQFNEKSKPEDVS